MSARTCPACESENVIGVEVRGVYDGVLYWICGDCDRAFERDWSGYGFGRAEKCAEYVAAHNAGAVS